MEELKRLRKARGLSQAKLAALADLDPSTVSQIETGARRANTRTLERLAAALGAEVADLFPKAQAPLPFDGARRRGAKEAEYARSSTVPDRIGAAKNFEDNLRHFTEKWREEIKDPHKQ